MLRDDTKELLTRLVKSGMSKNLAANPQVVLKSIMFCNRGLNERGKAFISECEDNHDEALQFIAAVMGLM